MATSHAHRVSGTYRPFYAALAVASVALVFFPPFEDVQRGYPGHQWTVTYGTLFDMAGRPGGGPAVFGLLLFAVLVVLLLVAGAFRVPSAAVPGWIAGLGALLAVMLIAKPGTGHPTPDLSGAGRAGLALLFGIGALGLTHALHLTWAGRPPGPHAETATLSEPPG